jgi:hypothetical protein
MSLGLIKKLVSLNPECEQLQDSDSFDDQPPPIINYAQFITVKRPEAVLRRKISSKDLKDAAVQPKGSPAIAVKSTCTLSLCISHYVA